MTKYRSRSPGKRTHYHSDPENCPMIDTETMREISDRYVEYHEMDECSFCAGTLEAPNKGQSQ